MAQDRKFIDIRNIRKFLIIVYIYSCDKETKSYKKVERDVKPY